MPYYDAINWAVETLSAKRIVALPTGSSSSPVLTLQGVTLAGGTFVTTAAGVVSGSAGVSGLANTRLYANANGTTGLQPAATAAAKIVDLYTLPANTLAASMALYFYAAVTHAANTNTVTVAINIGGTGASGATVSGGTNIVSFALATSGGITYIEGNMIVQTSAAQQTVAAATTVATPATNTNVGSTVDLTAAQQISLTMNAATTATDATVLYWAIVAR